MLTTKTKGVSSLGATECKVAALRRVIALDDIGENLTIPELVTQLIEDNPGPDAKSDFECAIRDLELEGHLCCRTGRVHPTPSGFFARGESAAP